ncbi:MAG: class I SAM-dependent methyltransferase [Candidatus Nealsonbacteria bacterium]|nr:class I SAM-dependent methyltransferase [Candidatus Nealsonbacteria bacterium]
MWMKSRRFQRLGGGRLERMGIGFISRIQLMQLGGHKDPKITGLIRQVRRERKSLLMANEAFMVYSIARAQSKRPGAFAEVGVFDGGSARMTCDVKGDKELHLFDTFEGLPQSVEQDRDVHRKNQYTSNFDSVKAYLSDFENVFLHKGLFPDSAKGLKEMKFSFAHFDVDIYESTLGCLEYFYPRMNPGGIMLSHDYSLLAGVETAFTEFLADKPEELIELPTTQCMVVKL